MAAIRVYAVDGCPARELVAGSTRFNELRRGVPRMSPALLSQRLKELEAVGVITREPCDSEIGDFRVSAHSVRERVEPIVEAFGVWGQRRIEANLSLQHLDVQLLMWDMRRNLNTTPMPKRSSVIRFLYRSSRAALRPGQNPFQRCPARMDGQRRQNSNVALGAPRVTCLLPHGAIVPRRVQLSLSA